MNHPPGGKFYYIVDHPGGRSAMGDDPLYDTGQKNALYSNNSSNKDLFLNSPRKISHRYGHLTSFYVLITAHLICSTTRWPRFIGDWPENFRIVNGQRAASKRANSFWQLRPSHRLELLVCLQCWQKGKEFRLHWHSFVRVQIYKKYWLSINRTNTRSMLNLSQRSG